MLTEAMPWYTNLVGTKKVAERHLTADEEWELNDKSGKRVGLEKKEIS